VAMSRHYATHRLHLHCSHVCVRVCMCARMCVFVDGNFSRYNICNSGMAMSRHYATHRLHLHCSHVCVRVCACVCSWTETFQYLQPGVAMSRHYATHRLHLHCSHVCVCGGGVRVRVCVCVRGRKLFIILYLQHWCGHEQALCHSQAPPAL